MSNLLNLGNTRIFSLFKKNTRLSNNLTIFIIFMTPLLLCCISPWLVRSLRSVQSHSWRRGGEEGKREPDRQKQWHLSPTAEWRREKNGRQEGTEGWITFSFPPFSFPLADSEELMKEQYDNLLFCYFIAFHCPVRPGEVRDGGRAVTAWTRDLFAPVENISLWMSKFVSIFLFTVFFFFLHWHTVHLILDLFILTAFEEQHYVQ